MMLFDYANRVRRWLWLILGVPLVAIGIATVALPDAPFEVVVRATVLIPGDTENPGRAERPELMVLDDVPPMIDSLAFADLVMAGLPPGTGIGQGDVAAAISGSRYSRIAAITIQGDDKAEVLAIATSVETAFPGAVNSFLVTAEDTPATVQVIDGATDPERNTTQRRLTVLVIGVAALGMILFILWVWASVEMGKEGTARQFDTQTSESK